MGQGFEELTAESAHAPLTSPSTCHIPLPAASWVRASVVFFFPSPHLVCRCCFMARDCFYGNILDSKQSNFKRSSGIKLNSELILGDCLPWAVSSHTGSFSPSRIRSRTFLKAYYYLRVSITANGCSGVGTRYLTGLFIRCCAETGYGPDESQGSI